MVLDDEGAIGDMRGPRAASGRIGWTVARHPVRIAGLTIPGEMLYVGRGLSAASGQMLEPSLIDPGLSVDWRSPDWRGETMSYWPSYTTITPAARAAYLRWLATGRRHPGVPVGYVFLFYYGLERRVLLELPHIPQAQRVELPLIRAELDQLLLLYGGNGSFSRYARSFRDALEIIDLLQGDVCAGPAPQADRNTPPARLRLGLSGFATDQRPVPADWALAWLLSCPGFRTGTSVTRCEPEFARLFHARYAERYGHGLIVRAASQPINLGYHPASAGFHGWNDLVVHRPEVVGTATEESELIALGEECAQALDAYSRYLGRAPDARGSITAAGLLPAELLNRESGAARTVINWARGRLGDSASVIVQADDLLRILPADRPAQKKDIIAVVQVLAAAGIGMEPDPRLGGPVVTSGPMVLFAEAESCSASSPAYRAAALLLHLGVVVGAADGQMSYREKELLVDHLERALYLSPAERDRLCAHLRWLLAKKPKLIGVARRVSVLDEARREEIAGFLTMVAAADGVIDAAEVAMLKRIRRLLDLDPEGVPSIAPVTVRPAEPSHGYSIPAPAEAAQPDTRVRLDEAALARKLAESAEVAALLDSVFAEDESQAPAPVVSEQAEVALVADLDVAHSVLLRALAGREMVSRGEWERLAADAGVMPDGALDCINESAYDVVGEPVAEGEDPIEINQKAMGELL